LAANAGVDGSVIIQRVKSEKKNMGYDVSTDKFVDMVDAGIIDPTKVTRSALQNAASIASLLLTTECLVTDLPEKDKPSMPPMPPGGGMGGMY
jgi:chaperonin GroEL